MAEFLTSFRRMASKAETVPGTAETLADADNNVRVWDLAVGALDVPMDQDPSKYATGDFGLGEAIPGPTSAKVSFTTKFSNLPTGASISAAGTEPNWTKFAKAAACETSAVTNQSWGAGYAIYPDADSAEDTLTIGVYDKERGSSPSSLEFEFVGCIGNGVISTEGTGKPYNIAWEYTGGLNDIADIDTSAVPVLTDISTVIPDRFLDGLATIGSFSACISTMEFDLGNSVTPVQCVGAESGYSKFGIVAQEPMLTINPLLTRNTDYDFWGKLIAGTIEAIVIETSQFRLEIPRGQIMTASIEDADGIIRTPLTIRPLRPTTAGAFNYASWIIYIKNYSVT